MDKVESLFSSTPDDEDVIRSVYLIGQPGSGKTELARQYGEQFKNATSPSDTSKPLVILLNANSEESLLESVKEATQKLRLPMRMELTIKNLEELMKNLRDYFRNYSGAWLLIIDDMFEKNDFNKLFPRPGGKEWGGGHVLITTQDNNLVPACHLFAKKLSLNEGMTKEDALALLKEISDVEVDDFAEEIIKELQSLPLSLACCATYVGETRQDRPSTQFGWKEYLDLHRENAKLEYRTFSNNNAYPFPMTTAITMAVKRMAETSDVLRLTFSFLSYCALRPVPLSVVAHYVSAKLPVEKKTLTTSKEIEDEISRCSLFGHGRSLTVETILFHQTVHHVFKSTTNENPAEYRKSEFEEMMKSLNTLLNTMDCVNEQDIVIKVLMRPHLQSFVDHANRMAWNNTADFLLISMKNGRSLFVTSNLSADEAIKSLEALHRISLDLNLPERTFCDILAYLGFYNLQLNRKDRYEDALNFLTEAYNMTENKTEEDWLLLRCRISFNLARAHCKNERVDRGVELMKESIDLAKTVYCNEEENVMSRYIWLVLFYMAQKKFWKLKEVADEAKAFFSNCAPDIVSLSRALLLRYLGQVYLFHGFSESLYHSGLSMVVESLGLALFYIEQYLEMIEKVLGDDMYLCVDAGDCMSLVCYGLINWYTKPDESKKQIEKAYEISQRIEDKAILDFVAELKTLRFRKPSIWDLFC